MYPDVSHSNPNRYVITNPSADLPLIDSDQACSAVDQSINQSINQSTVSFQA